MTELQARERSFLQDSSDGYAIYQLSSKPENHPLRFAGLSELNEPVQKDHYDLVYTGFLNKGIPADPNPLLERLYERFNLDRPEDFHGHSLSVSDVIVLKRRNEIRSFYTDSFGFQELPDFMNNPLRNAELSVEDDLNMIDGIINNGLKQEFTVFHDLKTVDPHLHRQKRRSELER